MTPEEHVAWLTARQLFNRLCAYSIITTMIIGAGLFPLYLGVPYVAVLEGITGPIPFSLSFWTSWRLVLAWPKIDLHLQWSLAVSLTGIGLEYAQMFWRIGYKRMYPNGYNVGVPDEMVQALLAENNELKADNKELKAIINEAKDQKIAQLEMGANEDA